MATEFMITDSDDDQPDDQQMDTQHTEQEEQPQPVPEQVRRAAPPPQLRVDPPEQVSQQPSQEAPVQVPMAVSYFVIFKFHTSLVSFMCLFYEVGGLIRRDHLQQY